MHLLLVTELNFSTSSWKLQLLADSLVTQMILILEVQIGAFDSVVKVVKVSLPVACQLGQKLQQHCSVLPNLLSEQIVYSDLHNRHCHCLNPNNDLQLSLGFHHYLPQMRFLLHPHLFAEYSSSFLLYQFNVQSSSCLKQHLDYFTVAQKKKNSFQIGYPWF